MPVFLVTPLGHNADQVGAAVRAKFPETDYYELQGRSGWLVSFSGTSLGLSNAIGVTSDDPHFKPELGSVMVTLVGSYYGRGSTTMWEWLKARFEGQR